MIKKSRILRNLSKVKSTAKKKIYRHVKTFVLNARNFHAFTKKLYTNFYGRFEIISSYYSPSGYRRIVEVLFWTN